MEGFLNNLQIKCDHNQTDVPEKQTVPEKQIELL